MRNNTLATNTQQLKRVAFTIIYDGLHHLQHKGFTDFMLENFDLWVVVEGHAKPGGSTGWCKDIDIPASSTDGTIEYMNKLEKDNDNLIFFSLGKYWPSKDQQVNMAIALIKKQYSSALLWQVDCDEHWAVEDIQKAEQILLQSRLKQASFQFNHYVGSDIIAQGQWGSDYAIRLFLWNGQKFSSHEPSMLFGQTTALPIPGIKFNHYSYTFAKDVKFKEKYYGYENLYNNWDALQSEVSFPQPITRLFSPDSEVGKGKTTIIQLRGKEAGMLL